MPRINLVRNFVAIRVGTAVLFRGGRTNIAENVSAFSGTRGFSADVFRLFGWIGDRWYSALARNLLTVSNAQAGVSISKDPIDWLVERTRSFGDKKAIIPSGVPARTRGLTTGIPGLGSCRVFVPRNSPLKRAGMFGWDIGANVLHRYEGGVLTRKLLWHPRTGAFPCGRVVRGINDVPGASCLDVHRRLNVNSGGCLLRDAGVPLR
jgi:hypothetical protein